MARVTVVIPNYNGMRFLPVCLASLAVQTEQDIDILVVDNGSSDQSVSFLEDNYPKVKVIRLPQNMGFARAVNEGIRQSRTNYVLLLNNDTEAEKDFVRKLLEGIGSHTDAFSASARMMQFARRDLIDDAGDLYNALGWAAARGKGKRWDRYIKECRVFSSCAGAAIYRREVFEEIGCFDEEHFAYLEDVDIGWRAGLSGRTNWYIPEAVVYHVGSGTSGSRHNSFKVRLSARNNVYMVYKNMPFVQLLLNLPLLTAGCLVKLLYFTLRGMGKDYLTGIREGLKLCRPDRKYKENQTSFLTYLKIQLDLWKNLFFFCC